MLVARCTIIVYNENIPYWWVFIKYKIGIITISTYNYSFDIGTKQFLNKLYYIVYR